MNDKTKDEEVGSDNQLPVLDDSSSELNKFEPVQAQALSPIEQMKQMKELGLGVEDMRGMLELQKEYEANEALKAFNIAMAAFKAESIVILKDKNVSYTTDKGTTAYDHASLGNIIETVVPFLSKHGISHRWATEQKDGATHVTCIFTHAKGHSEQTTLFASPDTSGGKNSIQSIASSITYLERYTFLAMAGLAARDQDDDGAGTSGATAESESQFKTITEEQSNTIHSMITDNDLDQGIFIDWMCKKYSYIKVVDDLAAEHYQAVIDKLNAPIANKKAG